MVSVESWKKTAKGVNTTQWYVVEIFFEPRRARRSRRICVNLRNLWTIIPLETLEPIAAGRRQTGAIRIATFVPADRDAVAVDYGAIVRATLGAMDALPLDAVHLRLDGRPFRPQPPTPAWLPGRVKPQIRKIIKKTSHQLSVVRCRLL